MSSPFNNTANDTDCPAHNVHWPVGDWPAANITVAIVMSAAWLLFMLASLVALFVRRNHQPLRSRSVPLIAATTVGLSCVFVVSSVREALYRDEFPCLVYLAFSVLAPASATTPLIARLLNYKNRVEFQMEFMQTRTENVADADAIARLLHLKYKTRATRAYRICAALFLFSVIVLVVYQSLEPRYFIHSGCAGCEMTTGDSILIVAIFLVLAIQSFIALRRLAKLTNGHHREVHDITAVLKIMCAGAISWIVIFRVDPGNLHRDGVLSWGYVLDAFLFATVVRLVWVPVYNSYTNTDYQGKKVSLESVLGAPMLAECFKDFLKSEFSVENVRFVEEAREWKQAYPGEDADAEVVNAWVDTASDIFDTFVEAGALLEVNLSSSVREQASLVFDARNSKSATQRQPSTLKMLAAGRKNKADAAEQQRAETDRPPLDLSPDVFDDAVAEMVQLLERDSFPRFLASKTYTNLHNDAYHSTVATHDTSLSVTSATFSLMKKRSTVEGLV